MAKVKARKDRIAGHSNESITSYVKDMDNATVLEGHAVFAGDRRLRVGDELLEAERIFINVGVRPAIPPIEGLDGVPYLTNSSILDLEVLPESLVILGGGYVGVEFGQMYQPLRQRGHDRRARAAADVERGRGRLRRDPRRSSRARAIEVVTGARIEAVGRQGDAIRVALSNGGRTITGSHFLVAAGRKPNTDDLGLETTGIEVDDEGFIEVDDHLRTSVEGVFALGDCNGRGAFTHTSYNDYEILAANLLDGDDRKLSDRFTAYAAYIDPPYARVGASESELRQAGRKALTARMPMSGVARARERSETQGFMKILVDAHTDRFLGAQMIGIRCDEVIHCILYAMYAGAPYTALERAVPIHPNVAELLPTMLKQLEPLE